ncbi:hypothetical protein EVA_19320 [gut metagenome]|uniref:Uncharacterized protein n=1 Tax=gut metagenome TaxID=749906 RepID=J9FDU4_9ZZZZ
MTDPSSMTRTAGLSSLSKFAPLMYLRHRLECVLLPVPLLPRKR